MFFKRNSIVKVKEMDCCGCFGFSLRRPKKVLKPSRVTCSDASREFLLDDDVEDDDDFSGGDMSDNGNVDDRDIQSPTKKSDEILMSRMQNGLICRECPVKETHSVFRSENKFQHLNVKLLARKENLEYKVGYLKLEAYVDLGGKRFPKWFIYDEDGNKTVNEYVRERKIGAGSYGKVVLYRNRLDGKHYAIKAFHKSHLLKLRVAPSETAMTDVFREVLIMKVLSHPNIVNLVEVINDPTTDHFYMVLEYVEDKWVCEGAGPKGCLEENTARKYLRDVVCGLMYLHSHNIVHGDIKPDNLLITSSGTVKIGDFSVSQVFEDDNDELRRSPGTPVFTAPECCLGLTYHGKAADTWAVGVTLYCMVLGNYPFLGETLQDTYDKIVNTTLSFPDDMNPLLKDLLEGLLCKDPMQRLTLENVAEHPWVIGEHGPIPQHLCWCKRNKLQRGESAGNGTDTLI